MKQYRLKKWYPSLAISWRTDDRYEYDSDRRVMTNISKVKNGLVMPKEIVVKEWEIHPDFWEEVEEPLFITEDGVEVFDGDKYILIGDHYNKIHMVAYNCNAPYSRGVKKFKHEPNADEYILWNKPIFSLQDIDSTVVRYLQEFDKLKQLAKERSEQ